MLDDLSLAEDYRSGRDLLLDKFYIPCLNECVAYDRAVGYFSSAILAAVSVAYSDFVRRSGSMRLICSPSLTAEDFAAMKSAEEVGSAAQASVRADLEQLLSTPRLVPATRLLATLIANGHLQVRIAFADNPRGIFHDKLGVFEDEAGNRVSYVGSANETLAAWGMNYESFDVFRSWMNESELLRSRSHSDKFSRLWRGVEPGVRVERLDAVTQEQIEAVRVESVESAIAMARQLPSQTAAISRQLLPHQREVLDDWRSKGHRGVVNFATGAGKTLTAIEAIRQWSVDHAGTAVVLVPGKDLHAQWEREVRAELPTSQLLLAGAGHATGRWEPLLPLFSRSEERQVAPKIVLVTNATFSSSRFQDRLRTGDHLLIVCDEMHRAGSRATLSALERTSTGATLGLSATYERKFDEEGTDRLLAVFGGILEPSIGLADAIHMRRLVQYDYRLHTLMLDQDEIEKYEKITKQIKRAAAVDRAGNSEMDSYLQSLLIRRARILKQARRKVPRAVEILLSEYTPGDRWLVYCDGQEQLQSLIGELVKSGLPALEFHSEMSSNRSAVLESFAQLGGVLVAIRCLDEGIDIPAVDRALILASSTAEREYIQRRGRVLRVSDGKISAEVHDLMLIDQSGGVLTRSEALRAVEFAQLSRSRAAKEELRLMLALSVDMEDIPDLSEDEDGAGDVG